MKKIIYTSLVILGGICQAQVVVGSGNVTPNESLNKEDLDVQGNLKVEAVENLCDEVGGDVVCNPYSQTFLDTENNNTMVKGNIPKIFQRLVFYVKIGPKEDRIVRFDTKINSKKYAALLLGSSILNDQGNPIPVPSINNSSLNATKQINLFEYPNSDSSTWSFSADYSSLIPNKIWRVELLFMDKSYVASIAKANPNAIYETKATDVARTKTQGGVGIGENDPKANLDVKGKLRIQEAKDVTEDKVLKNRTLPLVVDISSNNGDKTDLWGILKATKNTKIAYPVQLHINMEGEKGDFLYFLRLGLDPKKYTPILANSQLRCKNSSANWGIGFDFATKGQPTPNTYVTRWKDQSNHKYAKGQDDWALYLDFYNGDPKGCDGNTYWDAFLLVFRNENIISIPVVKSSGEENTIENPFDISDNYDETYKGYIGKVDASPLP